MRAFYDSGDITAPNTGLSMMEKYRLYYAALCSKNNLSVLTPFMCKCAIIRLVGVSISTKNLTDILQKQCSWERNGNGVSCDQFCQLCVHLLDKQCVVPNHESEDAENYYEFDRRNKGWITWEDFDAVSSQH